MVINIDLLFEKPEKDINTLIDIEPLAPLSMVSYMPGSYYRTEEIPTKHNLCGLFENILGWHFSEKDRKAILKRLEKNYRKKFGIKFSYKTINSAASGYIPLVEHLFGIENPNFFKPSIEHFDDLWTQLLYRDGYSHAKGTMNLSYELIQEKNRLPKEENGTISNDEIGKFFNNNKDKYPFFYSAPRVREFLLIKGSYKFKLKINKHLLGALKECLLENNIGYLGTSEGWVNTNFLEL